MEFPGLLLENGEEIKFCALEKCRIETKEGEIVTKKGTMMPQSLEARALEHIRKLE